MLSFYPLAARSHYPSPLYSARPVHFDDDIICLHPSTSDYSYLPRTTDPESHYRRALTEYLVAEEGLFRAREEATLRARAEALQHQEEALLLQARIIRARKEWQVQQLERALAQVRAAALVTKPAFPEVTTLPHMVPVARSVPEGRMTPISSVLAAQTPQTHVSFTDGSQPLDSIPQPLGQPEYRTASHLVPQNGTSAQNLESLLQARLRKQLVSDNEDEEVQDLARATLRHLFQHAPERDANNASALSSETEHDSATQSPESADLSRSDALQGAAAEAAKVSFKAHRATVAEQAAPSAPKTATTTIQDIRATLSKLSADFSIPPSLDFSDDEADGLAYTPTNAPIRIYEHALEGLLAQLDAVGSDGDEEVRVARRTVVKEVEMALEDVEKKVKRARKVAQDESKSAEDVLAEATAESSSDVVEDEDTYRRAESVAEAKTEEESEEHPVSILSHTTAATYSGLAPMSASKVDVVSHAVGFADVVPDDSAIEDTYPAFAEEPTEVVTTLTSRTRPATVRDGVARVYTDDIPESAYSVVAEQLIPAREFSVSTPSESHDEAVSSSPEGFTLACTPVSPAFLSPALPEDAPASRMSASPKPELEGEGAGLDDADNEDEWSEVEA